MKRKKRRHNVWWRSIFKNDAQGMLTFIVLLIIIGSINVYSATFVEATLSGSSMGGFFGKHLGILIVCGLAGIGAYRMDYRRLQNQRFNYIVMGIILFLLVAVFLIGDVVNGARRWISIGSMSMQPSEFAKLGAIIWTATGLLKYKWKDLPVRKKKTVTGRRSPSMGNGIQRLFQYIWHTVTYLAPLMSVPMVFFVATLLQPDMGTAVLILFFPFVLIVIAGLNRTVTLSLFGMGAVGAFLLAIIQPYRLDRLRSLFDPWSYAQEGGYQTVQGLLAIGSGGLWGQGFTHGTSQYFYLPEAHTDFAFAVWAQETGFIGSLVVVFCVYMFFRIGFHIAKQSRDYLGSLLATGITLLIGFQVVFNMFMVCGCLPVTGVPLPFISYGGSSMLLNLVAVGILANIAKRNEAGVKSIGTHAAMPSLREETQSRFKIHSSKGESHE